MASVPCTRRAGFANACTEVFSWARAPPPCSFPGGEVVEEPLAGLVKLEELLPEEEHPAMVTLSNAAAHTTTEPGRRLRLVHRPLTAASLSQLIQAPLWASRTLPLPGSHPPHPKKVTRPLTRSQMPAV